MYTSAKQTHSYQNVLRARARSMSSKRKFSSPKIDRKRVKVSSSDTPDSTIQFANEYTGYQVEKGGSRSVVVLLPYADFC
jgi:hypothetical protein